MQNRSVMHLDRENTNVGTWVCARGNGCSVQNVASKNIIATARAFELSMAFLPVSAACMFAR